MSLTLIPTPLQDDLPLETIALEKLKLRSLDEKTILLVEEHKVARNRWLRWGLPREAIEKFILYNEHTQVSLIPDIIKKLKSGSQAFLMSDCGLPAFCDPGQKLVEACHLAQLPVTATPFPNSISLALALSGFESSTFEFSGFIPHKSPEREQWLKAHLKKTTLQIWMDTPYRLKKLLAELEALKIEREICFALNLGAKDEMIVRGKWPRVFQKLQAIEKAEFILLIASR